MAKPADDPTHSRMCIDQVMWLAGCLKKHGVDSADGIVGNRCDGVAKEFDACIRTWRKSPGNRNSIAIDPITHAPSPQCIRIGRVLQKCYERHPLDAERLCMPMENFMMHCQHAFTEGSSFVGWKEDLGDGGYSPALQVLDGNHNSPVLRKQVSQRVERFGEK